MKINKKTCLIKLILGCNLNGFDPVEVEENITFHGAANWSCKVSTVQNKLIFYILDSINYKYGRFNYLKCIGGVEVNRESMTCKIIIALLQIITSITLSPQTPHIIIGEAEIPGLNFLALF